MIDARQVLLKLGVDTSQVGPKMDEFNRKVGQSSGHAHNSIMHVESAGRAFHRVLHQLTEQSPLLGIGLRLALNPIVGIIMAVAMAFQSLREEQKKAAEEAKKYAKESQDAWMEAIEATYSKDPKQGKAKYSLDQKKKADKEDFTAQAEALEPEMIIESAGGFGLSRVRAIYNRTARWVAENIAGYTGYQDSIAARAASLKAAADASFVGGVKDEKAARDLEEQAETEEKIEKIQDEGRKLEAQAAEKNMTREQKLNALLKEREDFTRSGMDMGEDQLSQAEAELELNKLDLKIEEQKKDIKDHNLKVEKERATLTKDLAKIDQEIARNARKDSEDEMNKHRMTHDQLLSQGTWWTNKISRRSWFQPSPLAQLEEYSQRAGNESGIQSALLHPEAAKYWAAESKRTRMLIESTGAVKTETLEAENSKNITRLTELAQRDGFLVRLKDLDNE